MHERQSSPVRVAAAGLAVAAGLVARAAFWVAIAYPAVYVAVHLRYGFGTVTPEALVALVAGNAVAVVVGHHHARARAAIDDSQENAPATAGGRNRDAPTVEPTRGD